MHCNANQGTLESGIDLVGQRINIGTGKFVKKSKRRDYRAKILQKFGSFFELFEDTKIPF